MSNTSVCRTAPATPGLVKIADGILKLQVVFEKCQMVIKRLQVEFEIIRRFRKSNVEQQTIGKINVVSNTLDFNEDGCFKSLLYLPCAAVFVFLSFWYVCLCVWFFKIRCSMHLKTIEDTTRWHSTKTRLVSRSEWCQNEALKCKQMWVPSIGASHRTSAPPSRPRHPPSSLPPSPLPLPPTNPASLVLLRNIVFHSYSPATITDWLCKDFTQDFSSPHLQISSLSLACRISPSFPSHFRPNGESRKSFTPLALYFCFNPPKLISVLTSEYFPQQPYDDSVNPQSWPLNLAFLGLRGCHCH